MNKQTTHASPALDTAKKKALIRVGITIQTPAGAIRPITSINKVSEHPAFMAHESLLPFHRKVSSEVLGTAIMVYGYMLAQSTDPVPSVLDGLVKGPHDDQSLAQNYQLVVDAHKGVKSTAVKIALMRYAALLVRLGRLSTAEFPYSNATDFRSLVRPVERITSSRIGVPPSHPFVKLNSPLREFLIENLAVKNALQDTYGRTRVSGWLTGNVRITQKVRNELTEAYSIVFDGNYDEESMKLERKQVNTRQKLKAKLATA